MDLATCERVVYNIYQSTIADLPFNERGSPIYNLFQQILTSAPVCHRKLLVSEATRLVGRLENGDRDYLSSLRDWQEVWGEMSKDAARDVGESILEEEARLRATREEQMAEVSLSDQQGTGNLKRKASAVLSAENTEADATQRPRTLVIRTRDENQARDRAPEVARDVRRRRKRTRRRNHSRLLGPGATAGSPPRSFRRRARGDDESIEYPVENVVRRRPNRTHLWNDRPLSEPEAVAESPPKSFRRGAREDDKSLESPVENAPTVLTPMPTLFPRATVQRRPAPTEAEVRAYLENLSLRENIFVEGGLTGESSRSGAITGARRTVSDEEVRAFMEKLSLG